MSHGHTLDSELIWQEDGHLSDVAVTSLADGQIDLLPESAQAHAVSCAGCTDRVGRAALLSLDAGALLQEIAAGPASESVLAAPAPVRRPLPGAAIGAALVLAVLGLLPSLPVLHALLMQAPGLLLHAIPAVARSAAVVLLSAEDPARPGVLWCAVTVMLMAAGLVVARLAPRRASKGEH